jgi:DNA adenine methylase
MEQLPLPGISQPGEKDAIVNVASVTHRSPFRYPGGKTWLVPRIRLWLNSLELKPAEFIEPFAGGGIIGLTVAFEQLAEHVTLIELDEQVAAVWQTIIESDDGLWLADQIAAFDLNIESVDKLLIELPLSTKRRAFQTIVKNRVNRGGILADGAGRVKYGEGGRGLSSRWYPTTLRNRISDIVQIRDRLCFVHEDGLEVIQQNAKCTDAAFFVDPPYTASDKKPGNRLYNYSDIDHEGLFATLADVQSPFLLTYDHDEAIIALAKRHGFDFEAVAMKNTHHAKLSELLISKDLRWLQSS